MSRQPVRQRLGPASFSVCEAGCTEHCQEDMGITDFASQPVDHDPDLVPGIINEQLLLRCMILPHRNRQHHGPAAIQIAKSAISIAVGMIRDILVPQDLQCYMLALQLAVELRPVELRTTAMSRLLSCIAI